MIIEHITKERLLEIVESEKQLQIKNCYLPSGRDKDNFVRGVKESCIILEQQIEENTDSSGFVNFLNLLLLESIEDFDSKLYFCLKILNFFGRFEWTNYINKESVNYYLMKLFINSENETLKTFNNILHREDLNFMTITSKEVDLILLNME